MFSDLTWLPPAIGSVTAVSLFTSALPGSVRARKTGILHQDPTPSVVTLVSCLLMSMYAAMIGDFWVFTPSAWGVVTNSFNMCTAMRITSNTQILWRIEAIACIGLTGIAVSMMVLFSPNIIPDFTVRLSITSTVCLGIQLLMFTSPCLQTIQAVKMRDASRISAPLTLTQMVNGCMWTAYGLAQGDKTIFLPNAIAVGVAFISIVVKAMLLQRRRPQADSKLTPPLKTVLRDALTSGKPVSIRSLWFKDQHLHVPLLDEEPGERSHPLGPEDFGHWTHVNGAPSPSALHIVSAVDDHVSLKTLDGRCLQVREFQDCLPKSSGMTPSSFFVVASQCAHPGPESHFTPVYAPAVEVDESAPQGVGIQRTFTQDSVGFWNPMHRVFIRLNEKGCFDCSAVAIFDPKVEGWRMPVGWVWERFVVEAW